MEKSLEQRHAIKFCVKLGKKPGDTYRIIQEDFGYDSLIQSQSGRWHKMFRKYQENVTDEARSGRPATSRGDDTVAQVRELLNSDQRMSVRLLSDTRNISESVIHPIVTEDL